MFQQGKGEGTHFSVRKVKQQTCFSKESEKTHFRKESDKANMFHQGKWEGKHVSPRKMRSKEHSFKGPFITANGAL
jgi:hypothetical protein